jgi:hypothetical protein
MSPITACHGLFNPNIFKYLSITPREIKENGRLRETAKLRILAMGFAAFGLLLAGQ